MAKMDTLESLPQIFRLNSLFLLPVSRKEYGIVKGKGYHRPESIDNKPIIHDTSIPFPISASGVESESVYLDYANSCGLLSKLCGTNTLVQSIRGRRTTPSFNFRVDNSEIRVNHAQIEVDVGFEGPDQIVLFEAKIGIPSSFNIRQLYYPYRTFYSKKRVRNFFFCLEPITKEYFFWEYSFNPDDDFESIKLVCFKRYQIKISKVISIKDYQDVIPDKTKFKIPQADDVNKIVEFPLKVFEGYDTAEKISQAYGFVNRQSSYYRHAAEILGLVRIEKNRYTLTDKSWEFLKLPADKKLTYITKLLLEFPIVNEIFIQISINRNKLISRNDIIELLRSRSHLTGNTLSRRAQTIISWFRWIRNNLQLVEVDDNGSIRLASQYRLN